MLKVKDMHKKIQSNVIEFGDIEEDSGSYNEININVTKSSDISPTVRIFICIRF